MKPPSENENGKHLYQELLAIRAKRGDKEAFDEIVRTFERPMFYYVRRLVESDEDAWDVLQETWVKAFRGLGSLRETKRFRIWLYAIAHRTVMSHYRTGYRRQAVLEEVFGSEAAVEADCSQFAATAASAFQLKFGPRPTDCDCRFAATTW